jgi:hypothetical protein
VDTNEVNIAFEILLEEVETVVASLNEQGAEAFQNGDHDRARELLDEAPKLTDFHDKVKALQKEWAEKFADKAPAPKRGKKRRHHGKLKRGLRTPEEGFRQPILEALVELDGGAHRDEVLSLVEKKMKGVLNEHDYEHLPSPPVHELRWRKTANWCRYNLVREGLLKSDSPRGVWEVTKKGRNALAKMQ